MMGFDKPNYLVKWMDLSEKIKDTATGGLWLKSLNWHPQQWPHLYLPRKIKPPCFRCANLPVSFIDFHCLSQFQIFTQEWVNGINYGLRNMPHE